MKRFWYGQNTKSWQKNVVLSPRYFYGQNIYFLFYQYAYRRLKKMIAVSYTKHAKMFRLYVRHFSLRQQVAKVQLTT
jgi:hypothetical protein